MRMDLSLPRVWAIGGAPAEPANRYAEKLAGLWPGALEAILAALGTRRAGLTEAEAEARLAEIGPNEVAHERPPIWYVQLLAGFANPFILILVLLTAVSLVTGDDRGVAVLSTMISVSVLLRFWQEFRSTRAAEQLKAMVRTTATVLRRDEADTPRRREIPIRELVPGDIVALSAGDMIPADVRLITSRDLFVSQAVLTGEALPVEKYDTLGSVVQRSASGAGNGAPGLLDVADVCFLGTNVVSGTATAVVIATGPRTYFGSLAKSIVGQRAQTGFDRGVNSVSWVLIRFMAAMVPVVLLINGFTKGDWIQAFFFAVSVAVGLTPEMLPVIVTGNLAKGAVIMSRRKVVVKRLNAIQNFGAMQILCTDKTGTLTQDRIVLERHLDVLGRDDEEVLALAWLNSRHQSGLKNLLDTAVLHYADELAPKARHEEYIKIDELPFDFVRRRMSVIVEKPDGTHLMVCKGAIEELLAISRHLLLDGERKPLDQAARNRLRAIARDMNADGFRVIAVATREFGPGEVRTQYAARDEKDLVIRGFLAFLDPPKASAGPAIAALREHGIRVKILTGDNAVVTAKICREVGLDIGKPVLGRALDRMSDAELADLAERASVFAKMSPSQKAVPFDRVDGDYLREPRKWIAHDIARFMVFVGPISSIFDLTTFALLWFVFGANSAEHQALFQSGWFVEGLLTQTLIVHMIRTAKIPFVQSTAAPPLLLLTLLIMAIGIAIPFSPVGRSIGLVPLPWEYFPWLAATLFSYCLLTQAVKGWYIRHYGAWL